MKQRLFVVIVALAIFITAVWLLQTAAQNARPQLRPSPQQHRPCQDEIDLGDFKLNQFMSHGISLSLFAPLVISQILFKNLLGADAADLNFIRPICLIDHKAGTNRNAFEIGSNNQSNPKSGFAMTHAAIYDLFQSIDIDDIICVAIKMLDRSYYQLWIINEIHLEPEGIYVQYFPFKKGEVQLAFIAPAAHSEFGITAVKHLE